MSIDMYLSDSEMQAESVARRCDSRIDGYHSLQRAISDFYFNSADLSGKTYDSAKEYFMTVLYPLSEGGILLAEAVKEAVNKFPEEYKARVDTCDWKESELVETIDRLDNQIRMLYDIRDNIDFYLMPEFARYSLLSINEEQIELYEEMKSAFLEKLDSLREFNAFSPSIFSEIEILESSISQGLSQVKESWNRSSGTFIMPKDLSWRTVVTNKIKEKEEKYHKSKIKELEKYNIYAMPYEDPKTKEVKIMWFIDKDGVRIFDEELQDYVEKYGKNFVGMYEIVGWEKIYELDLAARRRGDGKNYLTDGQLPSGWEKWGQAGGFADSIYWYSSKSGLLDLALIAGLSYAASKSQTKASTGANVANVMDDVNDIPIGENAVNHLKNVEGFTQQKGIVGGHNSSNFYEKLDEVGGRVVSEKTNPAISGVKEIQYEIPKKGIDGQPRVPTEYKSIREPKTVYDTNIISDEQIYQWGQEAMKNGKITVKPNGDQIIEGYANNGLKFKGFIREDKITNFYPELRLKIEEK
ncbi:hypothetical protein Hs30E_00150 [Lactococcus hodotermopsidis]|uniref:LXG domain-containing protein n=1 Tax=Pseudolactococcus hodotermopsidis TaxID=2709157 RepID=A0A6A0BAP9_9LACT|nr:CdiA family toxin C-terminal domain-containing protein [Lactococcus hodotermopsidis]GFH41464.1 hypothetical protein Hs30E_00150 [Lactococcus hodotermopsidis]